MKRKWCFVMIVAAVVALAGCQSGAQDPVIMRYGPEKVTVGQSFNRQQNGENAIWTKTQNATPTTILVLGTTHLRSNVVEQGTVVTAFVPHGLTSKSGEWNLYLLDTATGRKSRAVVFSVVAKE